MSLAQDTEATKEGFPTPEELLDRARALVPVLAERAEECEQLGRLPDASIKAFEDAGFYRILQPIQYGGYEYMPSAFYRVLMELAKGCPSSAWNLAVLGIHNWALGLCDPKIAEDLWGEDRNVRFSSSYAPFGTAEKVEGGYILNGRWPWCSACDHSTWMVIGAIAENDVGKQEWMSFFLPLSDYEIDHSSWDTSAMKGTGSKNIVVKDAFVPIHRRYLIGRSTSMADPGRATFTADTYKVSFGVAFSFTLASVTLGIADGAIAHSIETMGKRKSAYTGKRYYEDVATQKMIAEAYSIIDGAHLKLERDWAEMEEFLKNGEEIPMDRRVFYRWHSAEIPRLAKTAVNLLIESSGGRSFMNGSPMQRYFRDVNCIANHQVVNYDLGATCFGYNLLTGDNIHPLV
jgi:3-hydroxy-9,10-secoandrosta-1,3,5(10)-triene-9,17-dione monooxygenase